VLPRGVTRYDARRPRRTAPHHHHDECHAILSREALW
jgi:hypothetical protein